MTTGSKRFVNVGTNLDTMRHLQRTTLLLLLIGLASIINVYGDNTIQRIVFRSAIDAPADDPDFQENPQKYFELYSMNPDGSDIQRITHNMYYENQPDVSPDGKTIVCSVHLNASKTQGTDPGWEIALIDMETGEMTLLTDNDYLDYGAHWNHDGTKIVYVSDTAERTLSDINAQVPLRYDIYTMNMDGSEKTQLTFAEPGEVNADPSFSFTSPSKILYIHSERYSGNFDLYMMDDDGGDKKLILEHSQEILAINDPMFNPDDTLIVFGGKVRESDDGNPVYNIFTINPDGGDLTRITSDDGEADVIPQYSPDGSMIAYYTYVWEETGNTHRIKVINSDGSNERVISQYPWESDPSWYTVKLEEPVEEEPEPDTSGDTGIPGFDIFSILVSIICLMSLNSVRKRIDL